MSEQQTEARHTYKTDDSLYDVSLLNEEARISFTYLVEVEAEIQALAKRIGVLRAAASKFHEGIQGAVTDDAIIIKEPDKEEEAGE
jgi:hypothetical protein|tara:strand:+ start:840 stop:1097 length:258 start_codon:yes stop_codon:yes gene_type:complete